jgi:hypothetical protein
MKPKGIAWVNTMDALFIFLGRHIRLKRGVLLAILDWQTSIV